MAVGTGLSRATGLLRTLALAWALGLGSLSDAYNLANTVPNMVFALVAGGPLSSALVPMLVSARDEGDKRLPSVVLTTVLIGSIAAAIALFVLAPQIIAALSPGARSRLDHESFSALAVAWLRLFALQVPFYGLGVFGVGLMAVHGRFALGALAPVITNLIVAAAAIAFSTWQVDSVNDIPFGAVLVLGAGTTAAIAIASLIQLWGAGRGDTSLRLTSAVAHPKLRELAGLSTWILLYVLVNQLGLAATTALASGTAGGISAYQWGFTVMQLPYAIVGVSVITTLVPRLARADGPGEVSAILSRPVGRALTVAIPSALGLWLTADLIAVALVGPDAALLGAAIQGFAISLVPFTCFQLLCRTSYAQRNSRTPALVNIGVNLVNLSAAAVLLTIATEPRTRILCLAVSHALSYVFGCGALFMGLHRYRQIGALNLRPTVLRSLASSGAMGLLVSLTITVTASPQLDRLRSVFILGTSAAPGACLYLALAWLVGLDLPVIGRRSTASASTAPHEP